MTVVSLKDGAAAKREENRELPASLDAETAVLGALLAQNDGSAE